MDDQREAASIEFSISPDQFSNALAVGYNSDSFIIGFGSVEKPTEGKPEVDEIMDVIGEHRFFLRPAVFKGMLKMMNDAISDFEATFGEISETQGDDDQ